MFETKDLNNMKLSAPPTPVKRGSTVSSLPAPDHLTPHERQTLGACERVIRSSSSSEVERAVALRTIEAAGLVADIYGHARDEFQLDGRATYRLLRLGTLEILSATSGVFEPVFDEVAGPRFRGVPDPARREWIGKLRDLADAIESTLAPQRARASA
jgi:hypothetical protein